MCPRNHHRMLFLIGCTISTRDLEPHWSKISKWTLTSGTYTIYLPPMTLLSPLNILVKLLTTTSAYGRTCTFRKFPTVSSITTANSYCFDRAQIRCRQGDFRSGLLGNSQNKARYLSPCFSLLSRSSSSSEEPLP